ncbi:MAG: translation initiation factor 2 [Gemmobacter sp.]
MKPNFALNLTHEAIVLLHRTARGWMAIGEAALDSADLSDALGYLRASALGLSPQGVTTKLILPNSQVLYTEVDAPGPDAAMRRRQVAAALDGLTPYPVEDLVFDTWGKGPRVQVAVVARETLVEAEAFIDQHRFNPVSFVAIPPAGSFGGEPFFGQTQAAARLLAAGESVARDQDPVSIVTRDGTRDDGTARAVREPAVKPSVAPVADAPTPAVVAKADAPKPAPEAPADAPAPSLPEVMADASAAKAPAPKPPAPQADVAVATARSEPPSAIPAPAGQAEQMPSPPPPTVGTPTAAPAAEPAAPASPDPVVKADMAASVALSVPLDPTLPEPPAPTGTGVPTPPRSATPVAPTLRADPPAARTAPAPAASPEAPVVPSFSSRRREEPARPPPPAPAPASADAPPQPRLTAAPVAGPPPAPPATATATRPPAPFAASPPPAAAPPPLGAQARTATGQGAPDAAATIKAPPAQATAETGLRPAVVAPATAAAPRQVAAPSPALGELPAKPSAAGAASRLRAGSGTAVPKAAMAALPASGAARPPAASSGDGSLRPGAATAGLGGRGAVRTRGKPRYLGLALTGVLLIFLMLVAAYSSLYLSGDAPATPPDTQVAATGDAAAGRTAAPAAPAPVIVSAGDPVEPDPTLLATPVETAAPPLPPADAETALADTAPVAAPVPEAAPVPVAEPAPEVAAPAEPPPAALAGDTDVALSTASAATGQDEIYLSTVDTPPPAFDATALPAPVAAPDPAPGSTAPPPPFGTVYQFDDQGRIAAGETGVVTPEGVWLIAARPPVVPPARPDALAVADPAPADAPVAAALPPASDPVAPDAAEAEPAEGAFTADASVSTRRPPLRPVGLVPPADAGLAPSDPQLTDPQQADPQQADDDASISRDDPRLATLRPPARPAAILAAAAEAQQAAAQAQTLAAASLVATPVALSRPADASPLAVPLSRRPAARPRDFTRAVAAAAAAATQPPPVAEPEPDPQDQAATPEDEPEPEVVASAAPRIPTRANVAKQATFKNAINLSKVNLIGIYGTPSNRYAMVRTSGGRFTKVKVGDRVDGGTVAAITASEVRYKKGGRMLALAMPRG